MTVTEPTPRIARYLLLRPLAGDRPAHLAYDPALQRRVRLVALASADHEAIAAARALARLREPHLVAVHDVGDDGGRPFVAQEFVDGRTLADTLADPTCDAVRVRALFRDLALALAAAHDAGVTHGALASDTALRVESGGRLRVADFGAHTDDSAMLAARIATDLAALRDRLTRALGASSPRRRGAIARRLDALAKAEPPLSSARAWADALGDAPERRRKRWLGAALGVGVVGILAWGARASADAAVARCDAAAERVAEAWNETRAAEIADVFAATQSPVAPAAIREVERTLDGWTGRWTAAWRDACVGGDAEAARVQDERMACLQRHRAELEAVVLVLAEADAGVVQRAVQTARSLPAVDACSDAVALARRPARARVPADESELEAVRSLLARGRALRAAGRYADGVEVGERALARARAHDDGPLVAEALALLGMLLGLAGDGERGQHVLVDAIAAAWRTGDDAIATTAWLELAFTLGETLGRPSEASWAFANASAAAERSQADPSARLQLARVEGLVAYHAGRFEDAVTAYRRALALLGEQDPDDVLAASLLVNLGNALLQLHRWDEARAAYGEAATGFERTLGPAHPQLGHLVNSTCALEYTAGDLEAALAACDRALRIRARALGPEHPDTAATLDNLGSIHAALGHPEVALELHGRALRAWEHHLGRDHARVAIALNNLANVLLDEGRLPEARAAYERALAIDRANRGADHPETAITLHNLGRVLEAEGRWDDALAVHREVLAIRQRVFAASHSSIGTTFVRIATCELALGRRDDARASLDRARALAKDEREVGLREAIETLEADERW